MGGESMNRMIVLALMSGSLAVPGMAAEGEAKPA